MAHELLFVIYLIVLLSQLVILIRRPGSWWHWLGLYAFEAGSLLISVIVMTYYNEHPGYMMSTLGHVIWSLGASYAYGFMIVITGTVHLVSTIRAKLKNKQRGG